MRTYSLAHLLLALLAVSQVSFRWPLERGQVTSTFGESRWDHFHDGIDIAAPDTRIYPVEAGKMLYYFDRSLFPFDSEPGAGNYAVVSHGDDIYSIYMHLQPGIAPRDLVDPAAALGRFGNTGHSFAAHLHFTLYNRRDAVSVNPYRMMPLHPDDGKPVFGAVSIRIGDRYVVLRNGSSIRLTQHYPLLVVVHDVIRGHERLGIYRLTVTHNGREVHRRDFSQMAVAKNGLTVGGDGFTTLYDENDRYRVPGITWRQGQNGFVFTARDYAGNETEMKFTVDVNLDTGSGS